MTGRAQPRHHNNFDFDFDFDFDVDFDFDFDFDFDLDFDFDFDFDFSGGVKRRRGVVPPASPDGQRGTWLCPAATAPRRRDDDNGC